MKFNKELTHHVSDMLKKHICVGIVLKPPRRVGQWIFFLVCEISGLTCSLAPMACIRQRNASTKTNSLFRIKFPWTFQTSLDTIANIRELAERAKPDGVILASMVLKLVSSSDAANTDVTDAPSSSSQPQGQVGETIGEVGGPFFESTGENKITMIKHRKDYTKRDKSEGVDQSLHHDAALEDNPIGQNNSGDEDEDDDAMSEVERLEQELQGIDTTEDTEESDQVQTADSENNNKTGVLESEELEDLQELQKSHERFVGAASEQQHQDGQQFDDSDNLDLDTQSSEMFRPYEDEQGESILERFVKSRSNTVDSGNTSQAAPSATLRQRRRQDTASLGISAIEQALLKWSREVKLSAESCAELAISCSRFDLTNIAGSLSHNVSLVMHEDDNILKISLVSWTSTRSKLEGRPIELDDDNRVIYPSHFTIPKLLFPNIIFMLSSVGARVRKKDREQVCSTVLRTRTMFESAIDALCSPALLFGTECRCAGCNKSDQELEGVELQRCAFCLLYWHHSCNIQSAKRLKGFLSSHSVGLLRDFDLTPETMPFILWYDSQIQIQSACLIYEI